MNLLRKIKPLIAPFAVFATSLALRLPGLMQFVTVDEPAWLIFSANFYFALSQGDFNQTVYDYHPAVTTMWIFTIAYLLYFPALRVAMKGYSVKYWVIERTFTNYHKIPLHLLTLARTISVLLSSGLLAGIYFLMRVLSGATAAMFVVFMLLTDPLLWGHARLLNHETLLSLLLLLTLLLLTAYLYLRQNLYIVLLASLTWGFALLTKSPAIVLLAIVAWMFLLRFIELRSHTAHPMQLLAKMMSVFLFWVLLAVGVFWVFWPGMWGAPVEMLYQVFGNAISYAFQGARLSVTQQIAPSTLALDVSGMWFYLSAVLIKTTPITWLGLFLTGLGLTKPNQFSPIVKRLILNLLFLAAIFIGLFGLAQGRNHLHYSYRVCCP